MLEQDLAHLPDDVREQLAILELELSEGDITQKGYEKKRNLILAKFSKGCNAGRCRDGYNTCQLVSGPMGFGLLFGILNREWVAGAR
ncbi:hypothetical protein ANCDUO_13238 [Ancylostoma duodenale]|uniref:DMAP1-binding domain-containing protein n=1 Tax=Ancylostoma duodenale TaxID=51022 RepID=A0A0C2GHN4_9BILA|nr:hypothetical protein ANCDUO_13238 [Ancylostoma duodenale]